MPSRFATGGDYASTFTSLYNSNAAALEAAAQRVDAQREAELAAQDSLIFTRWQEGKISGGELMAYINKRMAQTSYDKAQQAKWREAAITYGNQIADERAEAEYVTSGNIDALIGHYAARLGDAAKGTPEYLELAQRLKSLTEQRDTDNLRKQAKRITRAIERGDATNQDLIKFYRDQLSTLPSNSPLREQVQDAIGELRAKIRDEQFQVAMTKVDTELATGRITPAQAAAQKQSILGQFDIETRDPVNFWKWQEEVRQLQATPDPAEIAQLEFDLAAGNITQAQYMAKIEEFANRIEPFDLQAAWNLRTEAQKIADDAALGALPNPGAIGLPTGGKPGLGGVSQGMPAYSGTIQVVRNLNSNAIKHITQMDGSAYSEMNCTMASGAMLAYAMGYRGLSGADLRYLSGVTSAATNIQQLQGALEKVGVDGTRLSWENRIGFEQFRQRLANGSPAVLSGWLGDIPAQLNSSGLVTGHAMFAAAYDAKKDAFLMLDPAKGSDEGTWWPAAIVESFGWGGARDGQALFAPRGTIDPGTLRAGGKVVHISVNAPPQRPGTPPGAGGQFDPGPDTTGKILKAQQRQANAEQRRLARRLRDAGIEPGPELDTRQEVEAELDRRWKSYMDMDTVVNEWAEEYAQDGEDVQVVTVGGVKQTLSREDIGQMQLEILRLLDGQELFYGALEDNQKIAETRKFKAEIVTTGVEINSVERGMAIGRMEREVNAILDSIPRMTDPKQIQSALEDAGGIMERLGEIESTQIPMTQSPGLEQSNRQAFEADATEVELDAAKMKTDVNAEVQAQQGYYAAAFEIVQNPDIPREQKVDALLQLGEAYDVQYPNGWPDENVEAHTGDANGDMIVRLMQRFDEQFLLTGRDPATGLPLGEAIIVGGELTVVPTKPSQKLVTDPATGTQVLMDDVEPNVDVLDDGVRKAISDMGYDAKSLPLVAQGALGGGIQFVRVVPDYVPYEGVQYLTWGKLNERQIEALPKDLQDAYKKQAANGGSMPLDDILLSNGYLNTPGAIQQMRAQGILVDNPFMVQRIIVPNQNGAGVTAWYRDEGTRRWHQNNLPFVGRSPDSPAVNTIAGHQYTGMSVNEQGMAWPELEMIPANMDPTSNGVAVPYQDGVDPLKVGKAVRDMEKNGWSIDPLTMRDPDDPATIVPYTATDPEYVEQWGKSNILLENAIAARTRMRAEAMNKLTTVTPPGEAADIAFWDEQEKRQRAQAAGIDYDTGEWLPSAFTGGREQPPDMALLDELGITGAGAKRAAADIAVRGFDPLASAMIRVKGVRAANQAERARKAAEAASKAKAVTFGLPRITNPVGAAPSTDKAYDPLGSVRTPSVTAPPSSKPQTGSTLPKVTTTPIAPPPTAAQNAIGLNAIGGGR